VSDDFFKQFYQSLVFENTTVGQAQLDADNLFKLKFRGAENLKDISKYDEELPDWGETVQQDAQSNCIHERDHTGPQLPAQPSQISSSPLRHGSHDCQCTAKNKTTLMASVTPKNESATDWIYWIETDSSSGELNLKCSPPLS